MIYLRWFKRRNCLWWLGIEKRNFGDDLNPILVEQISGERPVWVSRVTKKKIKPIYLVIGSILHWSDSDTIVWGTGFGSRDARLPDKPLKICAVRGPLTRAILLKQGVECPSIYGDPALLYPKFYKPNVQRNFRLGIIPHYLELRNKQIDIWIKNVVEKCDYVKIINVGKKVNQVVDDINECQAIASSSLHGIIVADAYGIPSIPIGFSESIAKEFKFRDYYQSVNKPYPGIVKITNSTSITEILDRIKMRNIDIDLDKLLNVCPF